MEKYILTGTPGAGKTAILRQLEWDGFGVVEEAATDLIARLRELRAAHRQLSRTASRESLPSMTAFAFHLFRAIDSP